MPTYLFYPRRADGVSLTFIAEAAEDDVDALELAAEVASAHECAGVFVWEPANGPEGKDRFVGEVDRRGARVLQGHADEREDDQAPQRGAAAVV